MFNNPILVTLVNPLVVVSIIAILILHYRGVRWFYHLGPPLLNEEWQTSANESAVKEELIHFTGGGDLIVYHWPGELGCRFRFPASSGKHARAIVMIRPTNNGAVLIYQVRVGNAIPVLFAVMYCAAAFSQHVQWGFWFNALMAVFWLYWVFGRNTIAIDEFARLPILRRHLQTLGVHVCTYCGYDLFGREANCKCPECGRSSSLDSASDLTIRPRRKKAR